jgi:peptidoglycan-associated lipoprotein
MLEYHRPHRTAWLRGTAVMRAAQKETRMPQGIWTSLKTLNFDGRAVIAPFRVLDNIGKYLRKALSGTGLRSVAALGVVLFLAACASDSNKTAPPAPAPAPTPQVDRSTVGFFQTNIGDRVYFSTDQANLTNDAKAVLARQAEWLRINPDKQVLIEGHADERGTRQYNIALGARRADKVKNFLIGRGVDSDRVSTVSYGRERPVEVCSNDACWARNRRAVTVPQ